MSAPAPRKKPAKKAAPKARTPEERAENNLVRFEELRARAATAGVSGTITPVAKDVYVVTGAEVGDNGEDITFATPTSLRDRTYLVRLITQLKRMIDDKNPTEALALIPDILVGLSDGRSLDRLLIAFDGQPDADALLFGLGVRVIEHFNGPGAVDVEGGSNAS